MPILPAVLKIKFHSPRRKYPFSLDKIKYISDKQSVTFRRERFVAVSFRRERFVAVSFRRERFVAVSFRRRNVSSPYHFVAVSIRRRIDSSLFYYWYGYNDVVCGLRRGLPRDLVPTILRFAICGAAAVCGSRFGCLQ